MYFQGYGGPESHLLPPKPGTWLSSTAPQLSWLGGALDAPAPPGTCLEEVITGSALLGGAQHITPLWGCQPFLPLSPHPLNKGEQGPAHTFLCGQQYLVQNKSWSPMGSESDHLGSQVQILAVQVPTEQLKPL